MLATFRRLANLPTLSRFPGPFGTLHRRGPWQPCREALLEVDEKCPKKMPDDNLTVNSTPGLNNHGIRRKKGLKIRRHLGVRREKTSLAMTHTRLFILQTFETPFFVYDVTFFSQSPPPSRLSRLARFPLNHDLDTFFFVQV